MGALGALAGIAMLGGTALSMHGSKMQAEAIGDSAAYNARAAQSEADAETARIGEVARLVQSQNVTRIAKSGVTISGSPLEVLAYNARQAQRQADSIRRSTSAYLKMQQRTADSAAKAGFVDSFSGLLRGAGSAIGASGLTFASSTTTGAGGAGGYSPNFRWNDLSGLKRGGG